MSTKLPPIPKGGGQEDSEAERQPSERDLFLKEIANLNAEYKALSERLEELKQENEVLCDDLEKNQKTKEDQEVMRSELKNHQVALVSQQTFRLENLVSEKLHEVGELEMELKRAEDDRASEADHYEGIISALQNNISKKDQDAVAQAQASKTLRESKKELSKLKADFKKRIEAQELRAMQSKRSLEEKFKTQVDLLTEKMKSLSDSLMAETTKRTIEENIRLNGHIDEKSQKNQKLVRQNTDYAAEVAHILRHTSMLANSEEILAKRLERTKQRIKAEVERIRGLEIKASEGVDTEKRGQAEVARLEERLREREEEVAAARRMLSEEEQTLELERRRRAAQEQQLQSVLEHVDGIAGFMVSCIEEARRNATVAGGEASRYKSSVLAADVRKEILDDLLEILGAGEEDSESRPGSRPGSRRPPSILRLHPLEPQKRTANKAVQTISRQKEVFFSEPKALLGDQRTAVVSDVRPWGKRSEERPLTVRTKELWLRKAEGTGGNPRARKPAHLL